MSYAIFTARKGTPTRPRIMHAVAREDSTSTVCGHAIGRGTGLVRDGDYHHNRPCSVCWSRVRDGAPASDSADGAET